MRLLPREYQDPLREAGLGPAGAAALLLGVWLVPGTLASLETYAMAQLGGRELPFWRALAAQTPGWLTYSALTPLILHASMRLPLHAAPRLPKLIAHAAFALIGGIAYALVAAAAYLLFMPVQPMRPTFPELAFAWYLSALPLMILTYFAILGAGWAVLWFTRNRQAELRSARLEQQLSEARLGALRMQLHPHFLFNSLNAVTVLVRDGRNETAERVLELLGDVLRATLRGGGEHKVPLHQELDLARHYLGIEEVRFSDRLRVNFDVETGLEDALVPTLVLQPLIENAIRHGISRSSDAGHIDIRVFNRDDRLILEVTDDGPGPRAPIAPAAPSGGVGLANTRSRLAVLYDNATCELLDGPGRGATARVEIPLEGSRQPAAVTGRSA